MRITVYHLVDGILQFYENVMCIPTTRKQCPANKEHTCKLKTVQWLGRMVRVNTVQRGLILIVLLWVSESRMWLQEKWCETYDCSDYVKDKSMWIWKMMMQNSLISLAAVQLFHSLIPFGIFVFDGGVKTERVYHWINSFLLPDKWTHHQHNYRMS